MVDPDHAEPPWALAIDVGTSSVRAMLFDRRGRALDGLKCQQTHHPGGEEPGASEFDADAVCREVAACIEGTLKAAGTAADRIRAVGICTFWHSMVGVDANRKAVTPLYTWADTRPADAARRLRERLDPDRYHARTGCALHPSYYPARLLWFAESEAKKYPPIKKWLSPGEYLQQFLLGDYRCSVSMASATGLFNQNACDWDAETLTALSHSPDQLPTPTDLDQTLSPAPGSPASAWPALKNAVWVPAIGDGAASNVGSGCVDDRRIAINLGTSGAIRVVSRTETITIPPELWCYRLDRHRFVLGGAFSDGGEVLAWMRETLQEPGDDLNTLLNEREPDAHGLTFLPFLGGERSTGWRPDARATLHGLTRDTTPLDIAQAGMEAVALRFSLVADLLHPQFPQAEEIIASGGALGRFPVWAQMLADALGRPILLTTEAEASSRGAALVALRAAGLLTDESDAPSPTGTVLQPDLTRHDRYRRTLDRQQRLYHALFEF